VTITLEHLRRFRRWLAYHIYPEGTWNTDMSREIDRLIQIIEDLGGKP
jgi:hypothetical protein